MFADEDNISHSNKIILRAEEMSIGNPSSTQENQNRRSSTSPNGKNRVGAQIEAGTTLGDSIICVNIQKPSSRNHFVARFMLFVFAAAPWTVHVVFN